MSNNAPANSSKNAAPGRPKPKRPLSAYNLFFQHERDRILRSLRSPQQQQQQDFDQGAAVAAPPQPQPQLDHDAAGHCTLNRKPGQRADRRKKNRPPPHGKIGFANLARLIGKNWKALPDEGRAPFDALAGRDKKRYDRELTAWHCGGACTVVPPPPSSSSTSSLPAVVEGRQQSQPRPPLSSSFATNNATAKHVSAASLASAAPSMENVLSSTTTTNANAPPSGFANTRTSFANFASPQQQQPQTAAAAEAMMSTGRGILACFQPQPPPAPAGQAHFNVSATMNQAAMLPSYSGIVASSSSFAAAPSSMSHHSLPSMRQQQQQPQVQMHQQLQLNWNLQMSSASVQQQDPSATMGLINSKVAAASSCPGFFAPQQPPPLAMAAKPAANAPSPASQPQMAGLMAGAMQPPATTLPYQQRAFSETAVVLSTTAPYPRANAAWAAPPHQPRQQQSFLTGTMAASGDGKKALLPLSTPPTASPLLISDASTKKNAAATTNGGGGGAPPLNLDGIAAAAYGGIDGGCCTTSMTGAVAPTSWYQQVQQRQEVLLVAPSSSAAQLPAGAGREQIVAARTRAAAPSDNNNVTAGATTRVTGASGEEVPTGRSSIDALLDDGEMVNFLAHALRRGPDSMF